MMVSRWSPTTKGWVVIGAVALAAVVLVRANEVVTPFIWAAIFGYVFTPVVAWVQKRTRAPRIAVVTGVFAVLALGVYALGRPIVPVAMQQLRELPRTLPTLIDNAQALVLVSLEGTGFERIAFNALEHAQDAVDAILENFLPVAVGVAITALKTLIFIIALWYFLLDGPRLAATLRGFLPREQRDELLRVFSRVNSVLGQYVRGQVVLVLIMWTATTIGLSILGVPLSILLGFITGVLETIPIVGPITAGAIAVLVALGHPNPFGWSQLAYAGVVAAMYTVLRYAEDYLVIPVVIGRIVELHPLLVIFSLLVGGAVGGLLGILLAVPIAASLRIALLYALAKLRDEDPFPVIAETAAPAEERVAGVSERTA